MEESKSDSKDTYLAELTPSYIVRYPESNDLRLITFSYLQGCDLFHKIALLSKTLRALLPESGLLDQIVVITIKGANKSKSGYPELMPVNSFGYVIQLADSIQIQAEVSNLLYVTLMHNII